jgi:hypothetical protein
VPAKKSYHQNKRIVLNTVFHHRRWFIHWCTRLSLGKK